MGERGKQEADLRTVPFFSCVRVCQGYGDFIQNRMSLKDSVGLIEGQSYNRGAVTDVRLAYLKVKVKTTRALEPAIERYR